MAERCADIGDALLEEVILAQNYELMALVTLLERKGILTREELLGVIEEMGVLE